MNRDEAITQRQTFYDDPKGCRNGHAPARRYVSTRNCWQCSQSQNVYKPVRVFLMPEQKELFFELAKQFNWEIVQHSRRVPGENPFAEDHSAKIPV